VTGVAAGGSTTATATIAASRSCRAVPSDNTADGHSETKTKGMRQWLDRCDAYAQQRGAPGARQVGEQAPLQLLPHRGTHNGGSLRTATRHEQHQQQHSVTHTSSQRRRGRHVMAQRGYHVSAHARLLTQDGGQRGAPAAAVLASVRR
jgi:hypothetical protein